MRIYIKDAEGIETCWVPEGDAMLGYDPEKSVIVFAKMNLKVELTVAEVAQIPAVLAFQNLHARRTVRDECLQSFADASEAFFFPPAHP